MLVSMSDLAEVIFTKPTIDARTDPTRPPTAVIDTATGLVTPVRPGSRVTIIGEPEPQPLWMSLAMVGGAVLAFGAVIWVFRRLSGPLGDSDEAVIVRRRRPVVIYEDEPFYLPSPRRSEPTVVIEEPPNVLVNPAKKRAKKAKNGGKKTGNEDIRCMECGEACGCGLYPNNEPHAHCPGGLRSYLLCEPCQKKCLAIHRPVDKAGKWKWVKDCGNTACGYCKALRKECGGASNPGKKSKKPKKRKNTWTADGWIPTPDSAEAVRDGVVVWHWQLLDDEKLGTRTEDDAREMLENAARAAGSAGLIEDGDVLRMTVHGRTTERTVRRSD